MMRLPRKQSEGDLPQIAVATGLADTFECLLRKIGIDDSEFTNDQGNGRVHIYEGHAEGTFPAPAIPGSSPATTLWSDLARMKRYDMIIDACEGDLYPEEKPQASLQNFVDYANAGGRPFTTHWQYYWIADGVPPLPGTATFIPDSVGPDPIQAEVDTGFPKGDAFAQWLVNVGASTTKGHVVLKQPRFDATAVHAPSVLWMRGNNPATSQPAVLHYTFTTPVGAPETQSCGKVLYSDFHVEELSITQQYLKTPVFPLECPAVNTKTPNDLALEFMLFDLSSCIQTDTKPPQPPPTR
jgi:hypothetical protein